MGGTSLEEEVISVQLGEKVSFSQWLVDTEIEPKALELGPEHVPVLWDIHGVEYQTFCSMAGIEYETID